VLAALMAVTFAFQGVRGAYSEQAALKHLDEEPVWRKRSQGQPPRGVPCRDFAQVVQKVADEEVDGGILPVENSLAGNIDESTDLLVDMDVHVVGEVELRVRHCLLARKGTMLQDVSVVHSHPQGLRQCHEFLAKHPDWRLESEFDTAGSAALVAKEAQPGHAAIASVLAAEHYDLDVLAEGIESTPDNYTRFFFVARPDLHPKPELNRLPPNGPGYKTSLIFATRHRPGALYDALGIFAKRDVNLTKLESRPRRVRGRRWEYLFFADCEGHAAEPHLAEALSELLRSLSFLKVLGSYPTAVGTST
jgi:prephenate dehydratase